MTVRLETFGDDPITIVEDETSDTEPVPLHSHPWDELVYVLEGEMSLTCGDHTQVGGPGLLATLPRGIPHTLHVTAPPARFLMITVGAPSVAFLKEVGQAYADGTDHGAAHRDRRAARREAALLRRAVGLSGACAGASAASRRRWSA